VPTLRRPKRLRSGPQRLVRDAVLVQLGAGKRHGDRFAARRPARMLSLCALRNCVGPRVGRCNRNHMTQLLVNVDVDDIERAIEFYRSAFGLILSRRLFGGSVAEMSGASSKLYLLAKPAGTLPWRDAPSARQYHRHWTPVHLDFEVPDVDAAIERATAAGARLEHDAQAFAWGRLAMMSDPFGHGFCLLQFTGAGYDAVESA